MPAHLHSEAAPLTTWKAALAGLLLFVAGESLVFRTGLYCWVTKPNSSTGWVAERICFDEWMPRAAPAAHTIVEFGDSRMGDALAEGQLAAEWPGGGVGVHNASIPGSSLRVWAYLLEQLDPTGDRFDVVVLPLVDYDDYDPRGSEIDRIQDLPFLLPLCGPADLPDLLANFDDADAGREVALSLLCATYGYRRDLQDFAAAPRERYRDVRWRFGSHRWGQPYDGADGSLEGIGFDGEHVTGLPANASPQLAGALTELCQPRPQDAGREREHRRRWLGRIADHLRGGRTRLVVLRIPSRVLPVVDPRPAWQPTLDELARRPHVTVLPRDLFADLEQPRYFRDALHVNRAARALFTARLGEELRRRFGADLGR